MQVRLGELLFHHVGTEFFLISDCLLLTRSVLLLLKHVHLPDSVYFVDNLGEFLLSGFILQLNALCLRVEHPADLLFTEG